MAVLSTACSGICVVSSLLTACSGICVVSSSLVVPVLVLVLRPCVVRVFVGISCLSPLRSGWVGSWRDGGIWVSEFVDVPFPELFVHCDMEPVAEFSVRVLPRSRYSLSSGCAFGAESFSCFVW